VTDAPRAPNDDGEPLATISRGPNRELRLRWREYKGFHFVDIREWSVNAHNRQWWPERGKGITIKPREVEQVIDALEEVRERAHGK